MAKQYKTLDTLKEAKEFIKEKKKQGYQTTLTSNMVRGYSYAGKNHTYYKVSYDK
jgi:hypothetical protein